MKFAKILGIVLVLAIVLFLVQYVARGFFKDSNALLKVDTPNHASEVFLDGESLGKTPLLVRNLEAKEATLKIKSTTEDGKSVEFETKITLSSQNLTSVNYEFGPNPLFSSGDIRTLRFGEDLSVVSQPKTALVWLDGDKKDPTPLSLKTNTGIHKLKVSSNGFLTREMEINVEPGLRLIVDVRLAADPFDKLEKTEDTKTKIYDLSTEREILLKNFGSWAEAIFFFDSQKQIDFDVLVDQEGKTYFSQKDAFDKKIKEGRDIFLGYLGSKSVPITDKASTAINEIKKQAGQAAQPPPPTPTGPQIRVTNTPTGFLNVRSAPSQGASILTRVSPGSTYPLVGEQSGWFKIQVDGQEGWVASQYAQKI